MLISFHADTQDNKYTNIIQILQKWKKDKDDNDDDDNDREARQNHYEGVAETKKFYGRTI